MTGRKTSLLRQWRALTIALIAMVTCIGYAFKSLGFTIANGGGSSFSQSVVGASKYNLGQNWKTEGGVAQGESEVTTNGELAADGKNEYGRNVIRRRHYEILEVIPHDPSAFTQGLTFFSGKLYESTGMYGESQLRHIDHRTGTVLQNVSLAAHHFGEGLTHFRDGEGRDRLLQLTWQTHTGFVYDMDGFTVIKEFSFETVRNEGWGVVYDFENELFIVSDGSQWLHFWDRDSFREVKRLEVFIVDPQNTSDETKKRPLGYINEMELVDGYLLVNVWYQDVIAKIDLSTGYVVKIYDFRDLYVNRAPRTDCFNGISQSDVEGELFVTGKWWPYMYRIRLLD